MDQTTIVIVTSAYFTAAFLKGITGLGFSTICLGLLAAVIDLRLAIPLMLIPSLSSNVLVMVDAGNFRPALTRFWPLFLAALPAIGVGLWFLTHFDSSWGRSALGVVLLVYGLWGFWTRPLVLPSSWERRLRVPVGVVTGFVNGWTGSQVMPVLPFLMSLGLPRELFVQAINISFTASTVVMAAGLWYSGLLDWSRIALSAFGVLPVAIGIWLGGKIRRRIPEALFRKLVMLLLIGLGVGLL